MLEGMVEMVLPQSNCLRLNLRWSIQVKAWNMQSLWQDDRLPQLLSDLKWLRVEVVALSEMSRPGSTRISMGGYSYYWLGQGDGQHLQGVAISIQLQPSFTSFFG